MSATEIPDAQEYYQKGEKPTDGSVGHLTAEQEKALKSLWAKVLAHFDTTADDPLKVACSQVKQTPFAVADLPSKDAETIERWYKENNKTASDPKTQTVRNKLYLDGSHDSAVPAEFKPLFQNDSSVRYFSHVFWQACMLHRNPDSYLLTFLRATLWNIQQAFERLVFSVNWRAYQAIDRLMWFGELEQNNRMMENGLAMAKGFDKFGYPVIVVRIRLNRPNERGDGDVERFAAFCLESTAQMAREYGERATILYDFTGFKMENVDLAFIKNLLSSIRDTYPQMYCSSLLYVDSWLFSGVWRVLKGFLDPVSAKRTIIVKDINALQTFVDRSQVIKEAGGDLPYEYKYIPPTREENAKMFDFSGRKSAEAAFLQAVDAFINETKSWTADSNDSEDVSYASESRKAAAESFNSAAESLDQYVRARSHFERLAS
ncbi:phosphatidylinositol transfer protein csr1 [Coemansia sp. RSA 1813]|nr:phosphatidylinositol transfer protein csr1 [Coemansia sp. RSA 1646]KAJ1772990.1 phosphatidylinositol transfer protein csr1 [Coemansia sp. RSA 1843]KAJ2092233.1 phosphatidylinositol transfer protein csr1 [Coemansia sp. RSA 986]KAJ2211349.1 phosphatidylinositol transfer protein csr1 [Coemansia sp. RSA 487]KAJ2570294.1 phosphatidylinositol transfer protein csr1 [Coemansia sp. RSA 1813]